MIFTSRSYAIGLAHFQIAGGKRTLGLLVMAYVAVASTLLGIIFYNTESPVPFRMMAFLYTFVMGVEGFVLVVFGSIRVGGCIRSDTTSNMIESHRLMPVASWRAILGYLFGANAHVLAITVLNLVLLAGLKLQMTTRFDDFVISQLVLVVFALFVWSFSAMGALMVRQMMPLLVVGFMFGSVASIALRESGILPGLSMLASPFLGETIFNLTGGGISLRSAYPLALSGELAFAALFFVGACRRYRGTYPSTFNIPQGLLLGLVWALLSVPSIVNWNTFNPLRFGRRVPAPPIEIPPQIVAALAIAALLAIIPLHGLVAWQKRHKLPFAVVGSVLGGAVLIALFNVLPYRWIADHDRFNQAVSVTALVLAAHVITMYLALRATRSLSPMATGVFACSLLFAVWVLPFILELIRFMITPPSARQETHFSILGSMSPLGMLLNEWTNEIPISPVPGLFVQWLVPVGVWQLGRRLNRPKPENDSPPTARLPRPNMPDVAP